MRQNEKVKTSVYSEYQNNQNDSISSRQLEFWLKQTAPIVQPKFSANQWTLMSTNSIFQQQEHTLQRNQTFQTINKENDYLSFNSARPTQNNSSMTKSKSYVNAMIDLQNKIKQLQTENEGLKQSVKVMKEQRNRVDNQSALIAEQMKNKLQYLEPKTKRIDQLVKQNKRLRDLREQNNKKSKILQKINKQRQGKLVQYERSLHSLKQEINKKSQLIEELQGENTQQKVQFQKNRQMLQKLQQKNKILEGMKQKSTSSIIEKYNKSVEMIEELTNQNMKLKQQAMSLKDRNEDKAKSIDQRFRNQKEELVKLVEKLKQQLCEKKQNIVSLNKDISYFKENYENKNNELIKTLRDHASQIKQLKEKHQKEATEWREKTVKYLQTKIQKRQRLIDINKESMIKVKQQEQKYQVQSQIQFEELNSIQQTQQAQQAPRLQTRSLDKKNNKHSGVKSIIVKPLDSLSQKDSKNMSIQSKPKVKINSAVRESKDRKKSHQKPSQKSRQKSRSRQVVQAIQNENENSFILKSCQPITQHHDRKQELNYSRQPYFYNSANNNPSRNNIPYYWQPNEIPEFAVSQRGNHSYKEYALQQALLVEANKQGIRLIQEQEKCINLLNENVNTTQRAQNLGRMKQIGEQIRLNSQKMLELKLKIAGQLKN